MLYWDYLCLRDALKQNKSSQILLIATSRSKLSALIYAMWLKCASNGGQQHQQCGKMHKPLLRGLCQAKEKTRTGPSSLESVWCNCCSKSRFIALNKVVCQLVFSNSKCFSDWLEECHFPLRHIAQIDKSFSSSPRQYCCGLWTRAGVHQWALFWFTADFRRSIENIDASVVTDKHPSTTSRTNFESCCSP